MQDAWQQLSLQAVCLWQRLPKFYALLALPLEIYERAPKKLHAIVLLGRKTKSDGDGGSTSAELTICRRGRMAAFCPDRLELVPVPRNPYALLRAVEHLGAGATQVPTTGTLR